MYLKLLQQEDDKTITKSLNHAMSSRGVKPATFFFLFLNLALYLLITIIASLEVNIGIKYSRKQASVLSIPAKIFPIYYPLGNTATGYVIMFTLLAGVVGFTTSATGLSNVVQLNASNLYATSASSLITWSLTLLATGFACKEKDIGWTKGNLNVLEGLLVFLSGTQLLGLMAIHVEIEELLTYGV